MTIGSLFSGIGGLELGLEWAGLGPVKWQVEQDEFCCKVLEKHWPDATRFRDVREVGAHNLEPVDVICGGFPCQDLSYAGKGAGLGGARSGLWFEYARIVRELRPAIVVVENVAALLGRGLGTVLGELAACGYDAVWDCIPAAAVGAPHRRDRLFIVAYSRCVYVPVERRPPRFLERQARLKAQHKNGNGCGTPLAMAVRLPSWPTPDTWNASNAPPRKEALESDNHHAVSLHHAVKLPSWQTGQVKEQTGGGKT